LTTILFKIKVLIMKKITFLLVFSIFASGLNGYSQVYLDSGLVGYWPFNGNANDMSTGGHNGMVYGATLTTDRFGQSNAAYNFNGIDNYIYVTNSCLINGDKFTLSVWAKGYGQANGNLITTGNQLCYMIGYAHNDSIRYAISTSTLGFSNFIYTKLLSPGKWCNYILTYDGSFLKLFINGTLVKTTSENGIIWTQQPSYLSFGGYLVNGSPCNSFYSGDIDDILIYNRVLNQNEINSILTGNYIMPFKNSINIYSNGTNNNLIIDFGDKCKFINNYTLKITNLLGQIEYTALLRQPRTTINLSYKDFKGIYFVYISDEKGNTVEVRKILLQ